MPPASSGGRASGRYAAALGGRRVAAQQPSPMGLDLRDGWAPKFAVDPTSSEELGSRSACGLHVHTSPSIRSHCAALLTSAADAQEPPHTPGELIVRGRRRGTGAVDRPDARTRGHAATADRRCRRRGGRSDGGHPGPGRLLRLRARQRAPHTPSPATSATLPSRSPMTRQTSSVWARRPSSSAQRTNPAIAALAWPRYGWSIPRHRHCP